MLTLKESLVQTTNRFSEDITEEIAFFAALREAEEAIDAGLVASNEGVKRKIELWTLN